MPFTKSPLRYPGGKTQLSKFVLNLLDINEIKYGTYCEPFSGGAGVSIELLLQNKVEKIILNDYDIGIFSLWKAILEEPLHLISLIKETPIDIREWERQRKKYFKLKSVSPSLELAFATLYLNRTNFSGVIEGGPLGKKDQTGANKIDCRFNKKDLINKIKRISAYKDRIELFNLDAKELIEENLKHTDPNSIFIFFDPPYYKQGQNLYTNFFNDIDHYNLSVLIKSLKNHKWITTYDCDEYIYSLYKEVAVKKYSLMYSANKKRKAEEYLFHSKETIVEPYDKVVFN